MAHSGYKITIHDWEDMPAVIDKLWEASGRAFDKEFEIEFYEEYTLRTPRVFTYTELDSTIVSFSINHEFLDTIYQDFIELSLVNYDYDNGTFKI